MKKSFIFVTLILGFLMFQNAYSKKSKYAGIDSSDASLVLWKVYTQSPNFNGEIHVVVDSVLKGSFHTKEKYTTEVNLNPNTYYLMLAVAECSDSSAIKGNCKLHFIGRDCIFPDTPKNREYLIKKFSETRVTYKKHPPK